MSEWKKVKLGECCEITSSKRCHASERSKEGIPFYCSKEIILLEKGESIQECDHIPIDLYNTIRQKYGAPQSGDLLLTTRGTNGVPYIYKDLDCFYFADGNLSWFRNFNDKLDVRYLYYWFKSYIGKHSVNSIAKGTAQKAVPIDGLRSIDIELPPLSIQIRIATILSRYDTLIENYQKQIKLLEEAAQRLYKEWFVDLRFPRHENTKMVDGLPEGWERKPLNEVFSYVRGKSYTTSELSDEGCIMVNLKNIQAFGGYKRGAEKRFVGSYKKEQTLKKGDLVMGVTDMTQERRLVGHVALIPDFNEPVTFSMDLIKLVPFNVPTSFLYCSMRYGEISKRISPLANGVNGLHLKPEAMMGIVMLVPCKELVEKFCIFVDETINKILNNQSQIRLLTEARDRLLPRLMGGEMEV
jgi:type I restriction enzyme S subunit